jgi:PKD repeat protein
VNAVSSDTAAPRVLTATGYGTLISGSFVSGSLDAPPVSVTVTSDVAGSSVIPVEIVGGARDPIPVVAQAGPDQAAIAGQVVTLDGSASTGAQTFSWTSPAGITLSDPNSPSPTFTPATVGTFVFTLTVTGPGGPSSATVTVTVTPAVAAVANAGPDQAGVKRGTKVTLDGRTSTGAATYAWTQVVAPGDAVATLTGANTAQPTFTFPLYKYPANNAALVFKLSVTSPDGSASTDTVSVAPSADVIAITRAQYTASKQEWRVDGTSSVAGGGQYITIHVGALNGRVLGTPVLVDATGAFTTRITSAGPTAGQTASAESQLGGTVAGAVIRVQ